MSTRQKKHIQLKFGHYFCMIAGIWSAIFLGDYYERTSFSALADFLGTSIGVGVESGFGCVIGLGIGYLLFGIPKRLDDEQEDK